MLAEQKTGRTDIHLKYVEGFELVSRSGRERVVESAKDLFPDFQSREEMIESSRLRSSLISRISAHIPLLHTKPRHVCFVVDA